MIDKLRLCMVCGESVQGDAQQDTSAAGSLVHPDCLLRISQDPAAGTGLAGIAA